MTTRQDIELKAIELLALLEDHLSGLEEGITQSQLENCANQLKSLLSKQLVLAHKPEWVPPRSPNRSNTVLQAALERGYMPGKDGSVTGPRGYKLSLNGRKAGYCIFAINYKGAKAWVKVHRLQALVKYGPEALFKEGILVRHLNGIKTDNSWDNIAIGTNSQNQMDVPAQVRVERTAKGATASAKKKRKIPEEEYEAIESFYASGVSKNEVCRVFSKKLGCSKSAVDQFIRGDTYKTKHL